MVTALTTDVRTKPAISPSPSKALLWKAWRESRARFAAAGILLGSLIVYAVMTSPGFLARYKAHFPDKPLVYSVYVWSGLFHYALQGLWVIAAILLAMGGLAQEKVAGSVLFTLALPTSRKRLFMMRAGMAALQAAALGIGSALLVPFLSHFAGQSYPLQQALAFGVLMFMGGFAVLGFGLMLSELFFGEFIAVVVGLSLSSAVFLGYKAHVLAGWNVFDVMSGTAVIDPVTQLLHGVIPWHGLALCLALGLIFMAVTTWIVSRRDA
jgi:ABC-type transport system involved in multi-copper enzyme maturation permease subunit